MLVSELIAAKQAGSELGGSDIHDLVLDFTGGELPEYQMSALLMAIYFQGLTDEEGRHFLSAMIASGDRFALKSVAGKKVDKHSTGGVGDKTSLIVAPVVAAAGIPVPMISGRALGHTGGTLDKLESIPGFRVRLDETEFETILYKHTLAFGAQTDELVPADRKIYALRDVTSTVSIPPLIAASILSKKIAEGTNALVMDVKLGEGGFLRNRREAEALAKMLVAWSAAEKVETVVFGSDMSAPLGCAAGNAPEVAECLEILRTGEGDVRLIKLCATLGGAMLKLGGKAQSYEEGVDEFMNILYSGEGYLKFRDVAVTQGADPAALENLSQRTKARYSHKFTAGESGYLKEIQPREIGWGLVDLGAGRRRTEDPVDPTAGVVFVKQVGDPVEKGDVLATAFWSGKGKMIDEGVKRIARSFKLTSKQTAPPPLLKFYLDRSGLRRLD